jgi:hypothetical protein
MPFAAIIELAIAGEAKPATVGSAPRRRDRRDRVKEELCVLLSPEQLRQFDSYVMPLLLGDEARFQREHRSFDLALLQRYILSRVFRLGWASDLFGEFDRDKPDNGTKKAERIGKKYQWIAYYEILARIADYFVFKAALWSGRAIRYEGPWQVVGLRDIDPSMVHREAERSSGPSASSCWWAPPGQRDWYEVRDQVGWLGAEHDLPSLTAYLRGIDPADGSRWLTLEANYRWEEPTPPGKEWSELSHRSLCYQVRAYIIREQDAAEVLSWAQRQNFWGRWMPESRDFHGLFLGELYWSPAYREQFADVRGDRAWTTGDRSERVPRPVVVPAMVCGGTGTGRDCSMKESQNIYVPTPWLADHLQLSWAGAGGEFCGPDGRVVARDPSVSADGPGALLVSEGPIRDFSRHGRLYNHLDGPGL